MKKINWDGYANEILWPWEKLNGWLFKPYN